MSDQMPSAEKDVKPICRCGVWRSAHDEGRGCGNYRQAGPVRRWLLDHAPTRHIIGRLWLALPEKRRWDAVTWLHARRPEACWCDLVDAAYIDSKRDAYACGCEVPLPLPLTTPRLGGCYCTRPIPPAKTSIDATEETER